MILYLEHLQNGACLAALNGMQYTPFLRNVRRFSVWCVNVRARKKYKQPGINQIMKKPIERAMLAGIIGYVLIVASVAVASLAVKLATGYYPSFQFFSLALVAAGLAEINYIFVLAPLIVGVLATALMLRTRINRSIASGIGLAAYYVLAIAFYLIIGAGDVGLDILALWSLWAFAMGALASKILDFLQKR